MIKDFRLSDIFTKISRIGKIKNFIYYLFFILSIAFYKID